MTVGTSLIYPVFSYAANYPAFQCCGCSVLSAEEVDALEAMLHSGIPRTEVSLKAESMGTHPLFSTVYSCSACGHTSCERCFDKKTRLCPACWYEQVGHLEPQG